MAQPVTSISINTINTNFINSIRLFNSLNIKNTNIQIKTTIRLVDTKKVRFPNGTQHIKKIKLNSRKIIKSDFLLPVKKSISPKTKIGIMGYSAGNGLYPQI